MSELDEKLRKELLELIEESAKPIFKRVCGDFFGERRAVMKIAWILVKHLNMPFREAIKTAWKWLKMYCRAPAEDIEEKVKEILEKIEELKKKLESKTKK